MHKKLDAEVELPRQDFYFKKKKSCWQDNNFFLFEVNVRIFHLIT